MWVEIREVDGGQIMLHVVIQTKQFILAKGGRKPLVDFMQGATQSYGCFKRSVWMLCE